MCLPQPDPNNPTGVQPPTLTEILLRAAGGALNPQRPIMVRDNVGARAAALGSRLAGGILGGIGESYAGQRLSPEAQALRTAEAILQEQNRPANLGQPMGTTLPISQFGAQQGPPIRKQTVTGQPQLPAPPPNPFAGIDKQTLAAVLRNPVLAQQFVSPVAQANIARDVAMTEFYKGPQTKLTEAHAKYYESQTQTKPTLYGFGLGGSLSLNKLDASIALNKAIKKDASGNPIFDPQTGDPVIDFAILEEATRDARSREATGFLNRLGQAYTNRNMGKETPEDTAVIKSLTQYLGAANEIESTRAAGGVVGRAGARGRPDVQAQEGQFAGAVAEGAEKGKPLEASVQTAINVMSDGVNVAQRLKNEFTPAERARYVGVLKYPANRIAQMVNEDPQFAKFQVLVNRAKSQAFGEGGKQLTPHESQVVFGYVPTGTEFSAADFEAKLTETLTRSQGIIQRRVKLSTTPRGRIQPEDFTGKAPPKPPPTGTPTIDPEVQDYLDSFKKGR